MDDGINTMKILSFHGSRILDNNNVEKVIELEITKHKPEYIVTHGEASGVCGIVRDYCKRNSIPLKLHFLNQKKYARGKYHYRSIEVIKECNYCIFIHDGKSKGTENEMKIAKKMNKEYSYHIIKDEGIDNIEDFSFDFIDFKF